MLMCSCVMTCHIIDSTCIDALYRIVLYYIGAVALKTIIRLVLMTTSSCHVFTVSTLQCCFYPLIAIIPYHKQCHQMWQHGHLNDMLSSLGFLSGSWA